MNSVECLPFSGSFNERCRACLCQSEAHDSQPLPAHLFSYCTNLQVIDGDGLPTILCPNCYDLLSRLYYFKQQCVRSDAVLKEQIKLNPQITQMNTDNSKDKENKTDFYLMIGSKLSSEHNEGNSFDELKDCDTDVDCEKGEKFHTLESKNDQNSDKLEKQNKLNKKNNKRSSTMLYCQKCDKSFYKYVKLEAHMRKHFGMKPDSTIKCNQCDKKFTTEKNLKSHSRVHSGERKYKCKTCGKAFAYLNVLKNHERAHAGIKKYVCHQCGKKFVQLTNLNTHLLQHTGEKPYICEPCNRRFGQPSEYKLHMLRHTGVKNFACNLCPLRFYTNANLQKHMGVHSDARPYACKTCEKRFKTRSYMAIHNRTHTGERPFSCDYCPMKFMSGKDKRNHHKTHTGEKAPAKPKKAKVQSQNDDRQSTEVVQNNEKSDHVQHQIDPNLNHPVAVVAVDNLYIPQRDVHALSSVKSEVKQNCTYDNAKAMDKQVQNNYFRIPTAEKTHCSFMNPMY